MTGLSITTPGIFGVGTGVSLTLTSAPAVSASAITLSGAPQTGGTATTNFPLAYLNTTGAAAVTSFSTAGTYLGVNAGSSFTGNILDFHLNGASGFFSVNYQGNVVSSGSWSGGSNIFAGATSSIGFNGSRGFISSPAAASIQLGATDSDTAPVAQTLRVQGPLVGGTSNVAGPNWTLIGALGKGNANSGDIIIQTGGAIGASGTTIATATTALTIKGVTGLLVVGKTFTVATLPAAAGNTGARTFITDGAAVPVFGAIAAGSGALFLPVFSDGTNWRNG